MRSNRRSCAGRRAVPANSTPYYLNRRPLNSKTATSSFKPDQQPESDNNAEKSHSLDLFQQDIEIQSGAAPEVGCVVLQKDLRGSSPLIVQQGKEFPFRVELGGGAELGQHLARDAMDAHARPLCAFAVAWIGDLPQQAIMRSSLQQDGAEGNLIQTVENVRGRARRSPRSTGLIWTRMVSRDLHPDKRRNRWIAE